MFLALVIICSSDLLDSCQIAVDSRQTYSSMQECLHSTSQAVENIQREGFIGVPACVPVPLGEPV